MTLSTGSILSSKLSMVHVGNQNVQLTNFLHFQTKEEIQRTNIFIGKIL